MAKSASSDSRAGAALAAATATLTVIAFVFAYYCATHSIDFPVYYRTATQILHGDFDIYPLAVYDGGPVPPHGFRYAPVLAFMFAPLAVLPLDVAAFLFFVVKAVAVAYVGFVVARHAAVSDRRGMLIGGSLFVVAGYAIEEFRYGNFHFLTVALMVFAFDAAESGSTVAPGVALAVAIATKLTPLLMLAQLAWRRRIAVCIATVAAVLALAIIPAAVVGQRQNVRLLGGFERYAIEKIDEGDNYSLRGVLLRSGLSQRAASRVWLAAVVAGGLLVAAALRRESRRPATRLLEFSIVLTAMLLASPHTQRRYFVALYVPVMALMTFAIDASAPRDRSLARAALAVTIATGTLLPLVFGGRARALAYESLSPYFFGAAFVFVALVVIAARQPEEAHVNAPPPCCTPV